mmetsp:Transcript_93423/g.166222  ORF Transcript_93423/g.166222 Transcript_93423/m.166222 type:complete len:238 (-) Transcript_93423:813-1526(-)
MSSFFPSPPLASSKPTSSHKSSHRILPRHCLSSARKKSLVAAVSNSDIMFATTRRAACLNRLKFRNLQMRSGYQEGGFGSFAVAVFSRCASFASERAFCTFAESQLLPSASRAVKRVSTFRSSSNSTSLCPPSPTSLQFGFANDNVSLRTFSSSSKGRTPHNRWNRMIPQLQLSHPHVYLSEYCRTSGAICVWEPTRPLRGLLSENCFDSPKSQSLSLLRSMGARVESRRFSALRSL